MKARQASTAGRQHGAATLVVVMMLFLVMALLAAYANRNLMFEQRIAGSYARGSLSQEVAEGGIEWALSQLNGPAIDAACKPVSTGGQRFVDKYLLVDPVDRTFKLPAGPAKVVADCTRNPAIEGWTCRCLAAAGARTQPLATGASELTPSFGVRFTFYPSQRNGTFLIESTGCTDSVVDKCRGDTVGRGLGQQAVSTFKALATLVSAVR